MGAGRSGTTALATFLGNNNEIQNIGEMHQFFEYLEERKECSCGDQLQKCEFWDNKISNNLIQSSTKNRILSEKFESHSSIVKHILQLFSKKEIEEYIEIHQQLLNTIQLDSEKTTLLDSSKYIGRALALDKLENIDLKVIYVVRDLRGVINSFSKNVQTSKSPLSTIVYYLVVNSVSEFVAKILLRKKVVKIRYEDLVNNPLQVFSRLETFLKLDLTDVKNKIIDKQPFSLGHIVGGNRLKKNKEIYFRKDVSWEDKFSFLERVSYYILAFPIMFLNRYKL
tara:strand:- start:490 stop:1335 length:846 start_codon:yes stop_codon:yes gene_type:complete